jgi:hypothetical protein
MADSSQQAATPVQNLQCLTSGDALKSHQVKIHGAKPQSNVELEEKADKAELYIMDMNIRLL